MIRGNTHSRRIPQQSLGQTPFLFRDARKPLQFRRVHNRHVDSGLSAVTIEEDGVDDLASSGWGPEEEVRNAEESLDIRDLLLDDAD